jgi:hypothetical protein
MYYHVTNYQDKGEVQKRIVLETDVIEESIENKSDDGKSLTGMSYRYQVDLRYAYQVDKRDFVGTSANWGWTAVYGLREPAEKTASQYRPGQPVTVYYDPEQPGNAVLEPDNHQGSLGPLIFAAIFAIIGTLFLIFLIKVGFSN